MDSNQFSHYVPRKLDAKARFLLWDFDTVAAGALGFAVGIIVNSILIGLLAAIWFVWGWSRIKAGRHPGYGLHFLYWHTSTSPFKRTPPSARRRFNG